MVANGSIPKGTNILEEDLLFCAPTEAGNQGLAEQIFKCVPFYLTHFLSFPFRAHFQVWSILLSLSLPLPLLGGAGFQVFKIYSLSLSLSVCECV